MALLATPGAMLGGYVADDAFYYLNIARNLAAGHGPTFDGSTATNGFHPLYMGLLWLLTSAGITEPVLLLRIALHCWPLPVQPQACCYLPSLVEPWASQPPCLPC